MINTYLVLLESGRIQEGDRSSRQHLDRQIMELTDETNCNCCYDMFSSFTRNKWLYIIGTERHSIKNRICNRNIRSK